MKYYFSLRINARQDQIDKITEIIGVKPNYPQVSWGYKINTKNNYYMSFVDRLLNMLNNKYEKLKNIGIETDDISIWMIYEYDEQCNMEFNPKDLKRLGENGITLCVSCYESKQPV